MRPGRGLGIAVSVVMSVVLCGGASAAVADDVPDVRIGPTYEDSVPIGEIGILSPGSSEDGIFCAKNDPALRVVASHKTWPYNDGKSEAWPGGLVTLRCGTSHLGGLRQIEKFHGTSTDAHQNSWEAFYNSVAETGAPWPVATWQEFMWDISQIAMDYSFNYPSQQFLGTVCFSRPMTVWKDGKEFSSWYVNTIVSRKAMSVVTSYLSDDSARSECGVGNWR